MPYSLEDFIESGIYEEKSGSDDNIDLEGGKVIQKLALSSKMLKMMNSANSGDYDSDPSRQDSAVITSLLNLGLSPADTYATFLHSARGQYAIERKNGHAHDYIQRTIRKASGFIKSKDLDTVKVDFSADSFGNSLGTSRVSTISFDKVESEKIAWLWKTRIPLGKVTVIAGDPGVGKSAMLIDIISRISRGAIFPDDERCPVGNCVIASAEDGLGDTLRPRLEAADADLSRVYAVKFVIDDEGRVEPLSLVDHLSELDQMIKETSARLVMVDPFNAYLPSAKVNTYKDQDIRGVMSVLTDIAQANGCAIVLIAHLNKKEELSALYRVGGSIGVIAAARSALMVMKDEEDENLRIIATIKSNLSRPSQPLSYELKEVKPWVVKIMWKGPVETDINKRSIKKRGDETSQFLIQLLTDGEVPVKQIFLEARQAGILGSSLRKSKEALGIKSKKIGDDWFWDLP